MLENNFSPMPVMLIASSTFLNGRPFIKCLAFASPMPSILRKSSTLPLLSIVSSFERSPDFILLTCPSAFFLSAGVASLSHGLDFDGPFLPAGFVVFFVLEVLLLDGFVLEDFALDEVFFDLTVFALEDFGFVLELFAFNFALGDLLAEVFLAALGLVFGFVLVCAWTNAGVERPIASKMARRGFMI